MHDHLVKVIAAEIKRQAQEPDAGAPWADEFSNGGMSIDGWIDIEAIAKAIETYCFVRFEGTGHRIKGQLSPS